MIIILNPKAGRRNASRFRHVLAALAGQGVIATVLETRAPDDAAILARRAAQDGATLVAAAGGDGTISGVAAGLIGTQTILGIIPIGTANVIAHELALPFAPDAVARTLVAGAPRPIWPGLANDRLFIQMLGIGFDAAVVQHLSLKLKAALGRAAYAVQTMTTLTRYPHRAFGLRLDNEPFTAFSAIICNGRFYAGRYVAAPDACLSKPGFTVLMATQGGPWPTLANAAALFSQRLPNRAGLIARQARHITIEDGNLPYQHDGDFGGQTPLRITTAPTPITVLTAPDPDRAAIPPHCHRTARAIRPAATAIRPRPPSDRSEASIV